MHDGVITTIQLASGEILEFHGMVFDIQQGGYCVLFGSDRPMACFAPGQWASVVLQGYEDGEDEEEQHEQFGSSDKKYH